MEFCTRTRLLALQRKVLPARFTSRLIFIIGLSTLLVLGGVFILNSGALHHAPNSVVVGGGSSKLILPNGKVSVIEARDDQDSVHMYNDFIKNPKKFEDNWRSSFLVIGAKSEDVHSKRMGDGIRSDRPDRTDKKHKGKKAGIECFVNGNQSKVPCLQRNGDIYLPFNKFISKYFQVYGDLTSHQNNRSKVFHFKHSIAPVWLPAARYQSDSEFLFFKQYDVEGRNKVELISAEHGVPVSNQWNKSGYIYPIQVAQYGLSHYSKYMEPTGVIDDRRTVLDDGEPNAAKWNVPSDSLLSYKLDNSSGNNYLYFNTTTSGPPYPLLPLSENRLDSCISFDVKFLSPHASVSIVVESTEGLYVISYTAGEFWKKTGEENMQYGVGSCAQWCRLHRDVLVDLKKFVPDSSKWKELRLTLKSLLHVELKGEGMLDNLSISKTCHLGHFKAASDWILKSQDVHGAWPVNVKRTIHDIKVTLNPGWYSAMAQGQSISLLVRAYKMFNKPEYLLAAEKALNIYQNLSGHGGVKAIFFNKYTWYEEYPTTPALFVLNGFIYSLFGLYDLAQIGSGQAKLVAQKLFDDGITSLKAMLPMFDSGSGTFYDLRHLTNPGAPPNRARWDYHAVHVAQLLNLATIVPDPLFNMTATRWLGYTVGELAPHN